MRRFSSRRLCPSLLSLVSVKQRLKDLGRSAAGGVHRAGFERMVAEVCLGKVGAVRAREVSRFAPQQPGLAAIDRDVHVVDTVMVDQETVYAPRNDNNRLLLGLKGNLNEYELDLLRQRSLSARCEKARRGELVVAAPVGFIKAADRYEKEPDRRVQEASDVSWERFEAIRTMVSSNVPTGRPWSAQA